MTNSPYQLTIALNALNFLGPNLYSNIPAVLSEMIANAWDADATEVEITVDIKNDILVVKDNGFGMTLEDMNEKYLKVGYQKRDESHTENRTPRGRHFMGRKGIGKLAIFSFAEIMKIQSNKNGKKSGCIIAWDDIEHGIKNNNSIYTPSPLNPAEIDIKNGTEIALSGLKKERFSQTILSLRQTIARRFTIIGEENNFNIIVNGKPLSDMDRPYLNRIEFVWYLGDESEKYIKKCKNTLRKIKIGDNRIKTVDENYKVRGWVGTVVVPSDIQEDQNNTIALFAHGKLVQEDILSDYQEGQAFAEYIIGNIEADFLDSDNEADIITADRQRVNQDDPRYQRLKDFIKDSILKKISRSWTLWRIERGANEALASPEIIKWYKKLNKTSKQKAARLLSKVQSLSTLNSSEKAEFYKICKNSFKQLKNTKGIASMDEKVFIDLLRSKQVDSSDNTKAKQQPLPSISPETKSPDKKHISSPPTQESPTPIAPTPEKPIIPKQTPPEIPETPPIPPDPSASKAEKIPPKNQPSKTSPVSPQPSQTTDEGFKRTTPPKQEVQAIFKDIQSLIEDSAIEKGFKKATLYDLAEAEKAYYNEGYKGCVVMFGAVLEGIMLAVIRKPKVLNEIRNNAKPYRKIIKLPGGIGHKDYNDDTIFKDAIADNITFEELRQVIQKLIPDIEIQKVEGIQSFRNAIHPWKAIKEPKIYGSYDFTRVMNHLTALHILAKQILTRESS